jgi:hypothetical protein
VQLTGRPPATVLTSALIVVQLQKILEVFCQLRLCTASYKIQRAGNKKTQNLTFGNACNLQSEGKELTHILVLEWEIKKIQDSHSRA